MAKDTKEKKKLSIKEIEAQVFARIGTVSAKVSGSGTKKHRIKRVTATKRKQVRNSKKKFKRITTR